MSTLQNKIGLPLFGSHIQIQDVFLSLYNPRETFASWTTKQKICFIAATSLTSLYVITKIKNAIILRQRMKEGYRPMDWSSEIFANLNAMDQPVTVFGLEEASSKYLTYKAFEYFLTELASNYINFRSTVHKIGGHYYYKEVEKFNVSDHIHKITLKLDDNDSKKDDSTSIQQRVIQKVVFYINQHNLLDENYDSYDRPHFDGFYFNFPEYKKVVILLRCDHVLADGLTLSSLVAILTFQIWDTSASNMPINFTKMSKDELLRNIERNVKRVFGQKKMNIPWSYYLYRYLTAPISFLRVLYNQLPISDPVCSINGKFMNKHQLGIGPPIPVKQFKETAHKHGGTVNDLFHAVAASALRSYMIKHKDPLIASNNSFHNIKSIGVVSERPVDVHEFSKEYLKYCIYGSNANAVTMTPWKLEIRSPTVAAQQKAFKQIKYGLDRVLTPMVQQAVIPIPGALEINLKNMADSAIFVSSNFMGPNTLMPLPPKSMNLSDNMALDDEDANDKNKNEGCVEWMFGQAIPSSLPLSFTICTYNSNICLGIVSDIGSIADPQQLIDLFMEEYKLFM